MKLAAAFIRWLWTGHARFRMDYHGPDVDTEYLEYVTFDVRTWRRFRELRRYYRAFGYR